MAIIDIIKNDGKFGLLAWKHPCEEPKNWTQLIVNEGEEAVLFSSENAVSHFTAGHYTLKTGNIPLLRGLINLPFGGKSPFAAELWYVNIEHILDIKWGTDAPICLNDGGDGFPLSLRGYGFVGVRISDTEKFLSALRGKLDSFDEKTMAAYLRGRVMQGVRESIAGCYSKNMTSAQLSEQINIYLAPTLAQCGMVPTNLIVSDLCAVGENNNDGNSLTFSLLSVVIPSKSKAAYSAEKPQKAKREKMKRPIVAASFIVLLLLILFATAILPPRQTCDFMGIAFAVIAHCLATAPVIWLSEEHHGLMVTVGFLVTTILYWLCAVGIVLAFRLFSINGVWLLSALELGLAGLAALAFIAIWYVRVYDPTEADREAVKDGED